MTRTAPIALLLLAAAGAAAAPQAVPPPPQLATLPAAQAASGTASAPVRSPSASAPKAHVRVVEDDRVRIEEARVRGQPQRITVHDKVATGKSYEIIVPTAGKDPSQDRGAAGQRTWSVLSF